MSPRERIAAALRHETPDRTPIFEYVLLSPIADTLLGRRYVGDLANFPDAERELGWRRAVRQSAIDQLELALLLGHDMMYVIPNRLPASGNVPAHAPEQSEDPVERVHARNERAAQDAPPPEGVFQVYADLKDEMRLRGVDLPILAPAYMHGVWTDVDLMQAMALAPEIAHRHFRIATDHALTYIEHFLALGIDQIGVGGDFSGTRPLISPKAYRTYIVPEIRRLSRRVHEAGRHTVNASDGDLWPVLSDFLDGCEADGYLEIDMHAGMDLAKLKAVCGDRITLYGNLDCGNSLSFGTPEQVRAHTLACIAAGAGNGGHILSASNAITASVPLENYLSVVNAYRDAFSLPRFTPNIRCD